MNQKSNSSYLRVIVVIVNAVSAFVLLAPTLRS
jgi:hypothetical protein